MNRQFRIAAIAALLMGLPGAAGAQHFAKYAGDFMSVGAGARALGMGGAYVAVADGSIASYWNPAGLMQLQYPEIHLMHAERFAGVVKYNFATAAWPRSRNGTFGFGLMRLGVDDIPITVLKNPELPVGAVFEDENGQPVRNVPIVVKTVNDVEYVGYLSYARPWRSGAWIGGNVKVVRKAVGDHSAWGIGFDLAVLTPLYRRVRFGMTVQDVTTTMIVWDTGNKELVSPNFKWGLALPLQWSRLDLVAAVDFDTRFENRRFSSQFNIGPVSFDSHFGLEMVYRKVAYLRFGADIGRLTAGAGIQLPKLRFDAAFLSHRDLGDTYRISATLSLEEEKFRRK